MISALMPQFVEYIPESLEEGFLYISKEYGTSIHLCACGCKVKCVIPFSGPECWNMVDNDGSITFSPSILQRFECKSHYFIQNNKIVWA